jgi:hypothetical protein
MDSIFTEMDLMLGYTFALIVVSVLWYPKYIARG